MKDQEIYQKIAKIMWSIMLPEAKIFEISGKCYGSFMEDESWFSDADGNRFQFAFDDVPILPLHEIMTLAAELKRLEPFAQKPWTHFKAVLHDSGKFKMEFAYVPEEENVIGVYMKSATKEGLGNW